MANITNMSKVILPVIRTMYPAMVAQSIIGVQPMSGNTGSTYSLNMAYHDEPENFDLKFERVKDHDRTWRLIVNEYLGADLYQLILRVVSLRMEACHIDFTKQFKLDTNYVVKFNTDGDEGLFLFYHDDILTISRKHKEPNAT